MRIITCPCGNKVKVSPSRIGRTKFCSRSCKDKNSANSGWYKKGEQLGSKNPHWSGDNLTYSGIHQWIIRVFGKAKKCTECGSIKDVQWANKSKKYRRQISDWKQLCRVCHRRFDGQTKLSKEQAMEIKRRHLSGERRVLLANEFNVSLSTISSVIYNKTQYYA